MLRPHNETSWGEQACFPTWSENDFVRVREGDRHGVLRGLGVGLEWGFRVGHGLCGLNLTLAPKEPIGVSLAQVWAEGEEGGMGLESCQQRTVRKRSHTTILCLCFMTLASLVVIFLCLLASS